MDVHADPEQQFLAASRHDRRRLLLRSALRILLILVVLVAAYAVVPVTSDDLNLAQVLLPVLGLAVFVYVVVRQIRRIFVADNPEIRALESLVIIVTFFVLMCSYYYVFLSATDPASFTEPVGKVAGAYFSMTVLSTVGFGDITPVTDGARIVVTMQMAIDVLIIGVAVRLLTRVAKVARSHRANQQADRQVRPD
ncbi:MAG: potassium channel family protein [Candidatus Nanopelagicales bacterium]